MSAATSIAAHVLHAPTTQRVIVPHISWATYERLLTDLAHQSAIRLAYDQGTLEIMSPLPEHEDVNRTIALLVEVLAEERGVDIRDFGSTTFRRADLARGFEPDSCFYIQHEAQMRGKTNIDLTVDPPPDLVIEVDMTRGSLNKLPLYAQIGVPEVWRYDGERVRIHTLVAEDYVEVGSSRALSPLPGATLSDLLQQGLTMPRTAFLRALRAWVREQRT